MQFSTPKLRLIILIIFVIILIGIFMHLLNSTNTSSDLPKKSKTIILYGEEETENNDKQETDEQDDESLNLADEIMNIETELKDLMWNLQQFFHIASQFTGSGHVAQLVTKARKELEAANLKLGSAIEQKRLEKARDKQSNLFADQEAQMAADDLEGDDLAYLALTDPGDHHLCVLVPVRDRDIQMQMFVEVMIPFLSKQQLSFSIWFVEQDDEKKFNRAKLLNIGVVESQKATISGGGLCDYFAFHDVDMLPLYDTVDYSYPLQPTHLASCVEQFGWDMPYSAFFGGVLLINKFHVHKANGMSNRYWGWGGEDDDFYHRLKAIGADIRRDKPYCERGIFKSVSIGHTKRDPDEKRERKLSYAEAVMWIDGLNTLKYRVSAVAKTVGQHDNVYNIKVLL